MYSKGLWVWDGELRCTDYHFIFWLLTSQCWCFFLCRSVDDMLVCIQLSFRDLLGCSENAVCLFVSVSTRVTGILKVNTLTLKLHQMMVNSRSSHLVAPLNGYMWTWDPKGIKRPKLRADIGKEHLLVILASASQGVMGMLTYKVKLENEENLVDLIFTSLSLSSFVCLRVIWVSWQLLKSVELGYPSAHSPINNLL